MKKTISSEGEQDHLEQEERTPLPNEGVVDWLLSCPEKGFFVPIESEPIP